MTLLLNEKIAFGFIALWKVTQICSVWCGIFIYNKSTCIFYRFVSLRSILSYISSWRQHQDYIPPHEWWSFFQFFLRFGMNHVVCQRSFCTQLNHWKLTRSKVCNPLPSNDPNYSAGRPYPALTRFPGENVSGVWLVVVYRTKIFWFPRYVPGSPSSKGCLPWMKFLKIKPL